MIQKELRASIAKSLKGQRKYIRIGRSANSAGFCNRTRIVLVDGGEPPRLVGQPYLKTRFSRAGFSKILYTPSTLHVVVGREWTPSE